MQKRSPLTISVGNRDGADEPQRTGSMTDDGLICEGNKDSELSATPDFLHGAEERAISRLHVPSGNNFFTAFSELDRKAPGILGWLTPTQLSAASPYVVPCVKSSKFSVYFFDCESNDFSHLGDTACKLILKNKWLSCCRRPYTHTK